MYATRCRGICSGWHCFGNDGTRADGRLSFRLDLRAMNPHVIPAADYRRERWRNGLGWTREISRAGGESDWAWRMSIAEVDADAAFSRFPGVDREICLLSGNGVDLCFDDGAREGLEPPHGRHRFEGERVVRAALRDGPVQVCNLMWRRDRVGVRVWHRPLVGSMVLFAEVGDTWLLHLLAGQALFSGGSGLTGLSGGDTAVLCSNVDERARYALEGGGEALVARITAAASGARDGHVIGCASGSVDVPPVSTLGEDGLP